MNLSAEFIMNQFDQVIIDIQHFGQTGKHLDSRGAGADIDGDGKISTWEREAELTPFYVHAASAVLTNAGVRTFILPITLSTYMARAAHIAQSHRDAVKRWWKHVEAAPLVIPPAPQTYVVLAHLNAGPGDYGLTLWHGERKADWFLADKIAKELARLGELEKAVVRRAEPIGDWQRAFYCLDMFKGQDPNIHIVLVEPWFLTNKKHQSLAGGDGPRRVGTAIANGILNTMKGIPL